LQSLITIDTNKGASSDFSAECLVTIPERTKKSDLVSMVQDPIKPALESFHRSCLIAHKNVIFDLRDVEADSPEESLSLPDGDLKKLFHCGFKLFHFFPLVGLGCNGLSSASIHLPSGNHRSHPLDCGCAHGVPDVPFLAGGVDGFFHLFP